MLLFPPSLPPRPALLLSAGREADYIAREKEVDGLLRTGKAVDAAKVALVNPPLASKNEALKEKNAALVLKCILQVGAKEADLQAFVSSLDSDSADNLMKYIYRELKRPDNSGLMLKLHQLVTEKAGMGCIVRAITDRKTA